MATAELPEVIIQHIQSLLDEKDAVRSTVLSKQWHDAWFTRPNLYLNDTRFWGGLRTKGFSQDFQVFATKTLERYKTLNLNLYSFKLRMFMANDDKRSPVLAHKLIIDALKLGANLLDVATFSDSYELTPQVFTSKSLRKLSLKGCKIVFPPPPFYSSAGNNIVCLELVRVAIDDCIMKDVLLGCPFIEKLNLHYCTGLTTVNLSVARRTLKHFSACCTRGYSEPSVEFEEYEGQECVLHEYGKLMSLVLDNVPATGLFLDNSHNKFPCLETIVFQQCDFQYQGTTIYKLSLSFNKMKSLTRANNMQCKRIDHVSYTTFDERFSDIKITVPIWIASCFLMIRNLLKYLSTSKISLVIDTSKQSVIWNSTLEDDIQSVNSTLPVVENLTIKASLKMSCCRKILCGLLWSCRPKFISAIDIYRKDRSENTLEVMYDELKKQVNKNCLETIHNVLCIHGLEDVTVETYDESLRLWRPAPEEAVRDGEQIRLRLKWG